MLDAIVELTNVRPRMRTKARFDPAELRAYHEGYYTGVIYAARVAELAIGRFKLRSDTLRAITRAKKSA